MIWAIRSMVPLIKNVDILPKILLDYNPVMCTLRKRKKAFRWRLNEEVLEKKENLEYI